MMLLCLLGSAKAASVTETPGKFSLPGWDKRIWHNDWTELDGVCTGSVVAKPPACVPPYTSKLCSGTKGGVDFTQTELDTSKIKGEYTSYEDDDTAMQKSTIATIAALSLFTRNSIEGDTIISLEVVDEDQNVVVPKQVVELPSHTRLMNAIDKNTECRKAHTLGPGCFPLDNRVDVEYGAKKKRRLIERLRDVRDHGRDLRGKKKKKSGATATGFFSADGTHGESRRREFGAFTSAKPHVFRTPYMFDPIPAYTDPSKPEPKYSEPQTAMKEPLNHWFWWKTVDPIPATEFTAEELEARKNHFKKVEDKIQIHEKKNVQTGKLGSSVYGFDFMAIWARYTKQETNWPSAQTVANQNQTVLQVTPTTDGYAGVYDSKRTETGLASASITDPDPKVAWDCHDLLNISFRIRDIYVYNNEFSGSQKEGGKQHKLFVRFYNSESSAACGTDTHSVAATLTMATVFDECAEYSPWACNRPDHKSITFILAGIVALGLLFFTYDYYRPRAKVVNEDE